MLDLTVIIPTRNRAAKLAATLGCLCRQTLSTQSFEVVVVDNGSSDHTDEIFSEFGNSFPFWRAVREGKPGAAAARNRGVEASTGPILLFLDDDVLADARLLEEHLNVHRRFSEVAVLGTVQFPWSGQEGGYSPFIQCLVDHPELLQSFNFPDPDNVPFMHFYTCNISLPRSLFIKVGGFDEAFTSCGFEDTDFGYRLIRSGYRIVHNPSASAIHNLELSFSGFIQKRYNAGLWLGYLLDKHPELFPVFFPPSHKYRRHVKLLLGRLCGLLRSPLGRVSSRPSQRISGSLARLCNWFFEYEFSNGFADYRSRHDRLGPHSASS